MTIIDEHVGVDAPRDEPSARRARSTLVAALTGPAGQPRWARPTLLGLLALTALLYLWGLGSSGWANNFYAAAIQAGTQN
jgi:hypothetical protein